MTNMDQLSSESKLAHFTLSPQRSSSGVGFLEGLEAPAMEMWKFRGGKDLPAPLLP